MGYIERGGGFKEDSTPVFVPKDYGRDLSKFYLQPSDITIAMTDMKDRVAILSNTAWVRDAGRFVLNQRVGCIRVKRHDLTDARFLYFYTNWQPHVDYLRSRANRGVQVNLSTASIKEADITLPSLDEQKSIAHILGTLDDKIELNRQMNATLEAMAQALFKSWFVDFDPVIDNALAAGHPIPEPLLARAEARAALGDKRKPLPTHRDVLVSREAGCRERPEAIQKQFPSRFVFNEEMGWMPEGWDVGPFEQVAEVIMGQSPKGDTYNSDGKGTPLVNGPVEFGEYFAEKTKWTTAPSNLTKFGDLIVCVRGSTTGRHVKSDGTYCLGRGVCAVRGKDSQSFVEQTYKRNIDLLLQMTTGSTFPNWSSPTLKSFSVILPTSDVLELFDHQANSLTEKVGANCIQIEVLSRIRNTLLPKLLSGQLRIPDAGKLIEEASA